MIGRCSANENMAISFPPAVKITAAKLDCGFNRLRSAGYIEDSFKMGRGMIDQFRCQIHSRPVFKLCPIGEKGRFRLIVYGSNNFGIVVADVGDNGAGRTIDIPVSGLIPDINTFCPFNFKS